MNKKITIIYGGAFNPPTLAHEVILNAICEHADYFGADVWVLPSGNRTDKVIESNLCYRLECLKAAIRSVNKNNVCICDYELYQDSDIETFDTAACFMEKHSDRQFVWVFGSDSIDSMGDWKNGDWLIDNLDILAIKRPGLNHGQINKKNIKYLEVPLMDVSSTKVRYHIANNLSLDGLVSQPVKDAITKHLAE